VTFLQKAVSQIGTDKSGTAGDEHSFHAGSRLSGRDEANFARGPGRSERMRLELLGPEQEDNVATGANSRSSLMEREMATKGVGITGISGGQVSHQQLPGVDKPRPRSAVSLANSTDLAHEIRLAILVQSKRANVGHIGSALSIADIVAALYGEIMHLPAPDDPERDRFVLSKGHAALALYAALNRIGWLTDEQLDTYCGDGSLLGVHPERDLQGIDFTTGSLGLGLALGAGAALAARIQGSSRRVYVLISDAECNEGSLWESAMFAAHHRLSKLTAILDLNGQQALGYTKDVMDLAPMDQRWVSFGWDVDEVDGHDVPAIVKTIESGEAERSKPHLVIANTVFGNGISFMQNQLQWHYLPMSDQQYEQALTEVGKAP
jgi:transketolase